jgi:hypothetical protein
VTLSSFCLLTSSTTSPQECIATSWFWLLIAGPHLKSNNFGSLFTTKGLETLKLQRYGTPIFRAPKFTQTLNPQVFCTFTKHPYIP